MDHSLALSCSKQIEPILDQTICFLELYRDDERQRYYQSLEEFFKWVLGDIYLRISKQLCSSEHHQTRRLFFRLYDRSLKLKLKTRQAPARELRILAYPAAFEFGQFAVQNMGCLDKMVRQIRDEGAEADFLWFRRSAGQAMGCLCELLNEMTRMYSEITFEHCLRNQNQGFS